MLHLAYYPSHGKSKILVSTALLVIVGMITITASAWLNSSSTPETLPTKAPTTQPTLSTLSDSAHQLQVERVTITPTGFDPEKIRRPRGLVMLAFDNRSGLDEVWLRLEREGGERLIDVRVDRKKLDWRGRVTLSPGRYRLTEVNHPAWLCDITITE